MGTFAIPIRGQRYGNSAKVISMITSQLGVGYTSRVKSDVNAKSAFGSQSLILVSCNDPKGRGGHPGSHFLWACNLGILIPMTHRKALHVNAQSTCTIPCFKFVSLQVSCDKVVVKKKGHHGVRVQSTTAIPVIIVK